jgi:predicted Zn-dependent peptidase
MILDDPEEIASHFAMGELSGTREHPAERRDQLAAVTRDQVISAARELFVPAGLNVVAVGAQNKKNREKLKQLTLGYV